jgi:hypothetical protein
LKPKDIQLNHHRSTPLQNEIMKWIVFVILKEKQKELKLSLFVISSVKKNYQYLCQVKTKISY